MTTKKTQKDRILEALAKGEKAKDIARNLRVNINTVYNVRYQHKKNPSRLLVLPPTVGAVTNVTEEATEVLTPSPSLNEICNVLRLELQKVEAQILTLLKVKDFLQKRLKESDKAEEL